MVQWDPKGTLDSIGLGRSDQKRSVRVADAIRNELALLLLHKVRDPKIGSVTVSRVEVTDDLKYAKIYYTVLGEGKIVKEAEAGLQRARGFMRSHLAKTLNMRHTPELQFRYDLTADKVREIDKLLQEIAGEKEENENNS
jgi:ribosome-binding factor A